MKINTLKKQDGLLLLMVFTFSYLFYEQYLGFNLLIFDILLIAAISTVHPHPKTPVYWVALLACIITSLAVVVVNTRLAVFSSFVSMIVLLGYVLEARSSLIVSFLNALYSILSAPFVYGARRIHQSPAESSSAQVHSQKLKLLRFGSVAIPVLVTLVFLSLYASANPAFSDFLEQVRFDFITWSWVRFTLVGSFFLFGVFYTAHLVSLSEWDLNSPNGITRKRHRSQRDFHPLALKFELKTGTTLLLLLNGLLLVFHLADASYILGARLPAGLTYSAYVHQGVYTLIVSIVLAILIIVYFLRGNLNFHRKNRLLVILTYAWIVQNIILALGIAYKNALYIEEYSLTYKRIGVYVYLFLVIAGLLTTYVKVGNLKNHWYLLRRNSWVAFLLLIFMSWVDWDHIITKTNLEKGKDIDYTYLMHLSHTNLPELQALADQDVLPGPGLKHQLEQKQQRFHERMHVADWRSWNYRDQKISRQLGKLYP